MGWNYMQDSWSEEQKDTVTTNAAIAACLYFGTFCLSIFCCIRTKRQNSLARYRDMDD